MDWCHEMGSCIGGGMDRGMASKRTIPGASDASLMERPRITRMRRF